MNTQPAQPSGAQNGKGTLQEIPPAEYWDSLIGLANPDMLAELKGLMSGSENEINTSYLPPPEDSAIALLDRLVEDGWLRREVRRICGNCEYVLSEDEVAEDSCPECHAEFLNPEAVHGEVIYIRNLPPTRSVDWLIAIHGMNTKGAWQEAFNWLMATTWGKAVPVAIYKYGIIRIGVLLPWRRRKFLRDLRRKLVAFQKEVREQGFYGNPDLLAHSFGTWLTGHLLQNELKRPEGERLKFGRIILAACILRPDYRWDCIKNAGLVEDVLNHVGAKDRIVPLAQFTIGDSGPSGRRGFNGTEVINCRTDVYGHSSFFRHPKGNVAESPDQSNLEHSYEAYWRPFLTLPQAQFDRLPNQFKP
ncbi:hypothetical protein ACFLSZ_03030 [Candidatus Bipolaricaulota bacterium]